MKNLIFAQRAVALVCLLAFTTVRSPSPMQNPRVPASIAGETHAGKEGVLASAGDISVVAFLEDASNRVYLRKSDGRGLEWASIARVDSDVSGSVKTDLGVVLHGNAAIVAWIDWRNDDPKTPWVEQEVYWNVVDVTTMIAGRDESLDLGGALDGWLVRDLRLAQSGDGQADVVYLLLRSGQGLSSSPSRLTLYRSLDHGASFEAAADMAPEGVTILDNAFDLAVDGASLYIVWADDRETGFALDAHLYFQVSDAYGQQGSFLAEDVELFDEWPGKFVDVQLDAANGRAAAIWTVEKSAESSLHARSYDATAGLTGALTTFVQPVPYSLHVPEILVLGPTSTVIVAWMQPVIWLDYDLRVSVSSNGGETFGPPETVATVLGAGPLLLGAGGSIQAPIVFLGWSEGTGHLTSKRHMLTSISRDLGVAWEPPVRVSLDAQAATFRSASYNALYRNLMILYRASRNDSLSLFVGGFRPQTVVPNGFEPGVTEIGFEFEHFDEAADPTVWGLLALEMGDLVSLEGKVLGLLPGLLLVGSIGLAAGGAWAADLDDEGIGSTSKVSTVLPAGVTLYAVGLGLDLKGASVDVGSITDVMEIDL